MLFLGKMLSSSVPYLADFVNSQAPQAVTLTYDLLDFSVCLNVGRKYLMYLLT